jgi:predicted Zn finger-like uncharacterized protein
MYTQCPDCSTAFRVTAEVLKQAAGKVRCGGCGIAFNALSYLSESMPEQQPPGDADAALPELKPEPAQNDDGLPKSISAAQSAALLKTLDELAGSDIRIEDTGVEWRVLDDDEVGEAAGNEVPAPEESGELLIDEILDESPTPVDQFLTETPAVVDSPEIFESTDTESPDTEFTRTSVDELRFDDNTPLPDDFDFDGDGYVESPVIPDAPSEPETTPDDEEEVQPQADFDLSEPDEWTDILGEFDDQRESAPAPLEAELEAAAALDEEQPESELEESLPESDHEVDSGDADEGVDEVLDMDSQFALQAEAMGIDLSGMHAAMENETGEDVSLGDADLEELLSKSSQVELEDLLDEGLVEGLEPEQVEVVQDQEQLELIDDERSIVDELGELEEELAELEDELAERPEDELEEELEEELDEQPEDQLEEELDEQPEDQLEEELDEQPEDQLEETPDEEPVEDPDVGLDDDLDQDLEEDSEDDLEEDVDEDIDEDVDEDVDEHVVPPLSEEEQTINMQIDQDLLALAIEDKDGFASTIVMPEASAEDLVHKELKDDTAAEEALKSTGAGFETIIMEGEEFRSVAELDKLEADTAAAAEALASAAAAERAAEESTKGGAGRYGIIGGIVLLLLLLAGQAIHQKREELATIPAFNSAVGPLYRAIGQPLSPAWDITGWVFEVAKGTEEDDNNLTIYSRLGNKSETPLPYPLIAVSLTDRVVETIGSHIFDPAEYLSNGLDPRKLVQPGNTFEAVIRIQLPEESTAGFRLRACYRTTDGLLRCKDDGFK